MSIDIYNFGFTYHGFQNLLPLPKLTTMKKFLFVQSIKKLSLLLLLAEVLSFSASANPGDTTWVTIWNQRKLTQYGNYDTSAVFPTNKRYRKIRMHYILGRYACPPGSQYCGSWDYTTQIYARPAGKDSVEIARVITPYATDWLSLGKKHDYIVEVTDYASALDGLTAMRFNYSGYSWGFTITLKLEFIEGIPPMDALSVKNVYDGYYPYGNVSNSIENYLVPKTFTYAATTARAFLKNTVSGHGADANDCSEFCSKYYNLKINNSQVSQKQIWRSDCGSNEVYPQTGTWIYERANWCPGAVVWPIYHDLTSLTSANTTFTVDVDMQTYTVTSPSAGFNWVSQLVKYSAPNYSLDVSIEDIVAPTDDDNYLRENPACKNPILKLKNVGTTPVTSVAFTYGLKNGVPLTYTWTGNLNFLQETNAVFPASTGILSSTLSNVFTASVVSVNGQSGDNNVLNNSYQSKTKPVTSLLKDFAVVMLTNNSLDPNTNFNESSWKLTNQSGSVIASRSNLANGTVYLDTLRNLPPGCYKFEVFDSGCDGLAWWANTAGGTGVLRLDYVNANNTIYSFPTDIGCGFTLDFIIENNNLVSVPKFASVNSVEVFPNPTNNKAFVTFDLNHAQTVSYQLKDIAGKTIIEKSLYGVKTFCEHLDLTGMSEGLYVFTAKMEDGSQVTKKLVVQQ